MIFYGKESENTANLNVPSGGALHSALNCVFKIGRFVAFSAPSDRKRFDTQSVEPG